MNKLLKILMLLSILSLSYSCNKDMDDDGIKDKDDNCETIANPNQEDSDNDGIGDACDDEKSNIDEESKISIIDGLSAVDINIKTFISSGQSIGKDGVFEMTKSGFIAATNNENRLIYLGFADESEVSNYTLDAKETALFLSMRVIPFIHMPENKKIIKSLKDIFYEFQEVKNLERKIISVISEHNALEIIKIQNELTVAGKKIIEELNLYRTPRVLKNSPTITNQYVNGIKIEKAKGFEDIYDEANETWNIYREFKSTLGGVIGVAVGDYNFETNIGNYDKNNADFITFLSPFNVGDFFDTFTTLEGLKNFYEDSQNIIESGFDPESSVLEAFNNQTWYAETTLANFEVKNPNKDGLMFVAPVDHYKVKIAAFLYLTLDILFEILSAAEPTKDNIKVVIIDAIINSDSAFELHQLIVEKRWDEFHKLSSRVFEQIIEDLPADYIKETFITLIKDDLLNIDGGDFFTSINAVITGINLWGSLIENTVSFIVQDSWAVPVTFDGTIPPPIVKNPYPFNITLQNVSKTEFSWTVEDFGEKVLFDFYIGTTESKMEENRIYKDYENTSIEESSFALDLKPDTRYYWRVVSKSENGLTSKSPIWYFDNGNFSFENQGLVAYYPFNDNANDESGNGNNGIVNNLSMTTDRHGNENGAYQIGGFSNPGHIKINNSPSLQFNNSFTFSAFVKLNGFDGMGNWGNYVENGIHTIFAKDHDRSGIVALCGGNDNKFNSRMKNDPFDNTVISKTIDGEYLNKWVHIVFTYDNDKLKLYINSDLVAEENNKVNLIQANSRDLFIGKFRDKWYPMNGSIDDLRIYNRALFEFEISDLYHE